ncbi:hypothetical protein MCAP1_001341 [Malassezia caprae]|uniref:Uncharacterized protein n=1 Tax=Malassezia caprae TaxID=1381934 RepID=A0AAF0IUT4_9BASI|nr:hypothetical protein MCAP1_001341 [Malassezia caprae]
MAFEHPMYTRVILAVALRCAFGALTLISLTHIVRSRPKSLLLGVLLAAGLSTASMCVANVDKDWMYLTRTLFHISFIVCIILIQRLIMCWFIILQHHASHEILLASLYQKFIRWNWLLLLGITIIALHDSTHMIVPAAIMLEFVVCTAWLDGSVFARRGPSLPTRSMPSVRYAPADSKQLLDVTLFHLRWDSHSLHMPYDGSRILFSKMSQSLVVSSVMLCASSAAHLLFYVICSRYTKLCDLDFEYIGFFFCYSIGPLPFCLMLVAPGFLSRFDTSRLPS